jgi:hypothetical protein
MLTIALVVLAAVEFGGLCYQRAVIHDLEEAATQQRNQLERLWRDRRWA